MRLVFAMHDPLTVGRISSTQPRHPQDFFVEKLKHWRTHRGDPPAYSHGSRQSRSAARNGLPPPDFSGRIQTQRKGAVEVAPQIRPPAVGAPLTSAARRSPNELANRFRLSISNRILSLLWLRPGRHPASWRLTSASEGSSPTPPCARRIFRALDAAERRRHPSRSNLPCQSSRRHRCPCQQRIPRRPRVNTEYEVPSPVMGILAAQSRPTL